MVQVIIEAQEEEENLETRVLTKELAPPHQLDQELVKRKKRLMQMILIHPDVDQLGQELVKRRKETSFKLIFRHPGVDPSSILPGYGDFAKRLQWGKQVTKRKLKTK